MSRDDAIRVAVAFANANDYRVVPSFEGLPWVDDAPLPVKLDAARWIDGEWAVLFDKMLHPNVMFECPDDICVLVAEDGGCRFHLLL